MPKQKDHSKEKKHKRHQKKRDFQKAAHQRTADLARLAKSDRYNHELRHR